MDIKNRIKLNTGMITESEYNKKEEYLNEGIVFFKNSKRIEKFAKKVSAAKIKQPILAPLEIKLNQLTLGFKELETKYKTVKTPEQKKEVQELYSTLTKENKELINLLNKEAMFKALKISGLAISAIAIAAFGIAFFDNIGNWISGIVGREGAKIQNISTEAKLSAANVIKSGIATTDPTAAATSWMTFGLWSSNPAYKAINDQYNNILGEVGTNKANEIAGGIKADVAGSQMGDNAKVFGSVAGLGALGVLVAGIRKKLVGNKDIERLNNLYLKLKEKEPVIKK
jgi:hypothetical protein